ncbi:MAG: DUF1993 domain-containing protein [Polyangiaceae bacterium]|nr:DUF1993 domain-containing protein [Polyangiaceae bacterium]
MSYYADAVSQLIKMLENVDRWLTAGEEHAKKKSFDPNVLLTQRLAPDQFALLRQVQAACDAAKFFAARLSGKTAPSHPDTETNMAELHARIGAVTEYLKGFSAADFAGADTCIVPLGFAPGKGMKGADYAREMALPNFYFHCVTAYSILRHNGVELGKRDYIGNMAIIDI